MSEKKKCSLISFGQTFAADVSQKDIPAYAASTAYFTFMALIPIMMLLFSILPYTSLTKEMITENLIKFVSPSTEEFLLDIVDQVYSHAGNLMVFSIIAMIWTNSSALLGMTHGLDCINQEKGKRNFIVARFFAFLYTFVFLITICVLVVLMMFGRFIANRIIEVFPATAGFLNSALFGRYLICFFFLTLIFGIFYAFLPEKKRNYLKQLPGAAAASAGWSIASSICSWYYSNMADYSMYGSLAGIVIFLLCLYLMMYMFLIGAQINKTLEECCFASVH